MAVTDLSLLGYLHDSTVLEIKYDFSQRARRVVSFRIICHEESGYEAWSGKKINIALKDVIILNQTTYGAVIGREEINSWKSTVTLAVEQEVLRLEKAGINCSGIRFLVTFHSGSHLEGICREINLDVLD